ncbi:glycosyltransferase family 2 protein [Clostridium estertheticum]|uniref:glycosyltransferase family A protein n=1 Tax=Clostridium estertheticum TaxID=238834 RepID=UPI0013E9540A|nr:glycosyltransferase family A protein [Clostridium estertheticum]MBZ9689215.1 glycosyltransferase family 2 protein [Clostridium estertheticum]
MKVEVLCATMHQTDLSKYKEMNIQTDAIFSNQADRHEYNEENINNYNVKMITTRSRGVGKNRNIGLLYSSADILMFSDDDMIYMDGYEEGVAEAFRRLPDADMIIFHCLTNSNRGTPNINKITKVRLWNFMRYGTFSFVIKKEAILKYNLNFSQLFGGGCRYCAGEDNLFLRDALKKNLKVYSHPFTIASVNHGASTWFEGFNEKYFYDNGAWLQTAFPILKHLLVWYFILKFANRTDLGKIETYKLQYAGMKAFKKGLSYYEWKTEAVNCKQ